MFELSCAQVIVHYYTFIYGGMTEADLRRFLWPSAARDETEINFVVSIFGHGRRTGGEFNWRGQIIMIPWIV